MANARELAEEAALALGCEASSMAYRVRSLREAGLLTNGGRGRSARDMGDEDTAVLLVSTLADAAGPAAVALVRTYFGLRRTDGGYPRRERRRPWDPEPSPQEPPDFGRALRGTLRWLCDPQGDGAVASVTLYAPLPGAVLSCDGQNVTYGARSSDLASIEAYARALAARGDLPQAAVARHFGPTALRRIASTLGGAQMRLLGEEASLVSPPGRSAIKVPERAPKAGERPSGTGRPGRRSRPSPPTGTTP